MHTKSLFELEEMLDNEEITSLELVKYFIKRIAKYDQSGIKLNSVAELNPNVEAEAIILDMERKNGKKRSPLHGIPVLLKDNINTKGAMHTTAGSMALGDLFAPYDATVTKQLKEAGMLILGKANLSEFAYFMTDDMPCGFSSRYGQVVSPYSEHIDPSGSSTGSAVAVAAGLTPVAIGTETNGSLTSPSERNNIVTIKPTVGLVSRYGIIPISSKQDTAGPMAKSVRECALLLDFMCDVDENDVYTLTRTKNEFKFLDACDLSVHYMKVGFLSFDNRELDELEAARFKEAKEILEEAGCICEDVSLENRYVENYVSLIHEFKSDLNIYLNSVKGSTKMTCLKDIIEFNKTNPEKYMPFKQTLLEQSQSKSGTLREEEYITARNKQLDEANAMIRLMDEHDCDVLVTVHAVGHAPIAGFPALSVPAVSLKSDTCVLNDADAMNMVFYARKFDEEKLFSIASYYEDKTKYRADPNLDREREEVVIDCQRWSKKYYEE